MTRPSSPFNLHCPLCDAAYPGMKPGANVLCGGKDADKPHAPKPWVVNDDATALVEPTPATALAE